MLPWVTDVEFNSLGKFIHLEYAKFHVTQRLYSELWASQKGVRTRWLLNPYKTKCRHRHCLYGICTHTSTFDNIQFHSIWIGNTLLSFIFFPRNITIDCCSLYFQNSIRSFFLFRRSTKIHCYHWLFHFKFVEFFALLSQIVLNKLLFTSTQPVQTHPRRIPSVWLDLAPFNTHTLFVDTFFGFACDSISFNSIIYWQQTL